MPSSRRTFLKSSAVAGAGVALSALPASSAIWEEVAGADSSAEKSGPAASSADNAKAFTRGIGIYPGDPRADFSPEIIIESSRYRNLALLRPAYHSSSYDYNLTAQLITDGIKDTNWFSTTPTPLQPIFKALRRRSRSVSAVGRRFLRLIESILS